MRTLTTLTLILFITITSQGQRLPSKIVDQPDGITIGYFNTKVDTCLPQIFIGDDLQILFPCYSKGKYKRVDISSETGEVKRLRQLLTSEFISTLNQCCIDKDCPDTIHGYFLMVKKGDKYDIQYLDIGHATYDKCGTDQLTEIIKLMNKLK